MALKRKLAEWFKRYFPAEVISTGITILAAWLMRAQGSGAVTVALVSTWTGNISYFGYILIADMVRSKTGLWVNLRGMVVEFGLAEALDSLLFRPLMMYYIPPLFNSFTLGIVIAKLLADLIFYIPAIAGYELNKKYLKNI